VFRSPFGGLTGNICCSSWAHWKVCSGLPISDNWTFLLVVMAEAEWVKTDHKLASLKERAQFGPKFQVEGVVSHQPFLLSENWYERSFMWCKNVGTSVFHFITICTFNRQTDRRRDRIAFTILCLSLHAVA